MQKRPIIVGVVGAAEPSQQGREAAYHVGRLLAEAGAALVTGGLGGVMHAASQGCAEAGGLVLGILPGAEPQEANPFVHIAIPSGLGHARNVLIAQTAQALIAIEGSWGTLSEVAIGCKIGRPVFCLNSEWNITGTQALDSPREAVQRALEALTDVGES